MSVYEGGLPEFSMEADKEASQKSTIRRVVSVQDAFGIIEPVAEEAQPQTPGSMGSSPSKQERPASQSSTTPLHVTSSDSEKPHSTYTTSISNTNTEDEISRPGLPRQVTHISALIDPTELREGWMVRSPSGNLLGPGEFLHHPERPLSLRERRERVKAALESTPCSPLTDRTSAAMSPKVTQMSSSSGAGSQGGIIERKKKRRWWLCCLC